MAKTTIKNYSNRLYGKLLEEYCGNCGAEINPLRETCPVCYKKVKGYIVVDFRTRNLFLRKK